MSRCRHLYMLCLLGALMLSAPLRAQSYVDNDSDCEELIDNVILYARLKLGCPYEWGGSGPNRYDCSGLVNYAFHQIGVVVTRTTSTLCVEGERVYLTNIKRGDLVFFMSGEYPNRHISHVGIAISDYENGDFKFIHASAGNGCVCISRFTDSNYQTTYGGARRIIRC